MKEDYKNIVNNMGRLKCANCGNTNMRNMYQEVTIEARKNLISERITLDILPYRVANAYDFIYCSVCSEVVIGADK